MTTKIFRILLICAAAALPAAAFGYTEYVVQLRANNTQFVNSTAGGGGPPSGNGLPRGRLMGNGNNAFDNATAFIIRDLNSGTLQHGDSVNIRLLTQGLFVAAEGGGGGWVNGNRLSGGGWETFTIEKASGTGTIIDGDNVGFMTSGGNYLCAESGGGTYLIADRSGLGAWETFYFDILSSSGPPYWGTPSYSPSMWSDYHLYGNASNQWNNNCYNYGANRITGTFAQCGRASNGYSIYLTQPFTLTQIQQALINDGWEPTTEFGFSAEGKMKVYLALAPSHLPAFDDFHFYRKDVPGSLWSHKPGQTPARDTDFVGNPISSPDTCDRGAWSTSGGYWFIPTFVFQNGSYANIH